jgi:large subunit ribosomal protein L31
MKKDIHPQYHSNATTKCVCGNEITIGSTKEKMDVEICSACHPFFTGKEKILDIAGRVEKFKERQSKAKGKK